MQHNFFISHYSGDQDLAKIIGNTLSRVSLGQINPWFSSDKSSSGGLLPGNIWLNEIIEKLNKSKAVVVILTPNSVDKKWLYYESGIGEANEDCEVIPVCVGIGFDQISFPLAMYQCYQLADYEALKQFINKLLKKFEIQFDEEMAKPILEKAVSSISSKSWDDKPIQSEEKKSNTDSLINDLKQHIDKRFIDLMDYKSGDKEKDNSKLYGTYSIPIKVSFPEFTGTHYLEIYATDTVQQVYDRVYFLLKDHVKPFTYMQDWILQNPQLKMRLVLREIGRFIPAKYVFAPNFEWEAIKLTTPYSGLDSNNNRDEWYS